MAQPGIAPLPGRDSESASALVGSPQPEESGDASVQNRAFMQQVRTLHEDLENLARQFPAMSSFAREAQDALKNGMVKFLAQSTRPAGSAQSVIG